MDNVRTVMIAMPVSIKAYTVLQDDWYTIVLNANLTHQQNLLSYAHELRHIQNGDFTRKCSVDMIEIYNHNFD